MAEVKTAIVVEDSSSWRDTITSILEQAGFKVQAYATGEEVLDAMGYDKTSGEIKSPPTVLVTDNRMPPGDVDGFALLKAIKGKNIPAVMLSGSESVEAAREAGGPLVEYLSKGELQSGQPLVAKVTSAIEKTALAKIGLERAGGGRSPS